MRRKSISYLIITIYICIGFSKNLLRTTLDQLDRKKSAVINELPKKKHRFF